MREINSPGIWTSNHSYFFSTHGEYLEKYKTLLRSFKRINIELDSELYFSFRPKVYISHNELVLCACMAIEGFLNFYGARRTYGNWYKENLERIGVTEKLSIIAALYFKDYDSPILIRLKKEPGNYLIQEIQLFI